jgi:hypothetical protein
MSELGSRQQTAAGSSNSGQQAAAQQGAQPAQQQDQQQLDRQEQQQQQQAAKSVPQQQQEPQQQQRVPLQERQVQQQAQAEPGELQQYSMKLAVPSQQPQEQAPQQQLQRRQTADVLTAAQQQLQHLFQQQPGSAGVTQQEQQLQEQLPAEAALLHVGSMHSSSPVKLTQTGWISASLDTTGIAGGSSGSPAAAGSRSPMRHSFPKAAAGQTRSLSPLQAALLSKETELELPTTAAAVLSDAGGMPAVDLARLGVGTVAVEGWQQVGAAAAAPWGSEAAAQIRCVSLRSHLQVRV